MEISLDLCVFPLVSRIHFIFFRLIYAQLAVFMLKLININLNKRVNRKLFGIFSINKCIYIYICVIFRK